jgi:hypothetical protein
MAHDHEHTHEDQHAEAHRPHPEPVVLDIGGDLGALVVYTDPELLHAEIEISPAADDGDRSHKDVLERVLGERSVYAAVFDKVPGGTYTLWHRNVPRSRGVDVQAGTVAELDWRT